MMPGMETDAGKRRLQEKALMYQLLNAQLEELSSQFLHLNDRMLELEAAKNALGEMGKVKEGSDMLVPIGAGCYGFGKLGKKGSFMVEIGAGLLEEKPLSGALCAVEERKKEIGNLQERVKAELEGMRMKMDQIGLELNEATQGGRGKAEASGAAAAAGNAARPQKAQPKKSEDDDAIMVE